MLGKVCVCSKLLVIVVSFLVSVANFAQKKKRHHIVVMPLLYTLRGSNPGPTD